MLPTLRVEIQNSNQYASKTEVFEAFTMEIFQFIIASVALTLMPGPDILFVITQSVSQGKKAGIIFATGLCTGLLFHIGAAAFGLSLIIKNTPTLFSMIQYAGAAYLIYLGIEALRHLHKNNFEWNEETKNKGRKLYPRGIIMNILNPKVSLFFLAFLPQFIEAGSKNAQAQIILLGGIFIVQAWLVFSLVSIASGQLSNSLRSNPKISYYIQWVKGFIFLAIGLQIAFSQL